MFLARKHRDRAKPLFLMSECESFLRSWIQEELSLSYYVARDRGREGERERERERERVKEREREKERGREREIVLSPSCQHTG